MFCLRSFLAALALVLLTSCQSTTKLRAPASEGDLPSLSCAQKVRRAFSMAPEWRVSAEIEAKIRKNFEDPSLSMQKKIQGLFFLLLEDRIAKQPKKIQWQIKKIAEDALTFNERYAEKVARKNFNVDHYDSHTMKVFIAARAKYGKYEDWGMAQYLILLHELTHAIDDVRHPAANTLLGIYNLLEKWSLVALMPLVPIHYYRLERKAIGSQWEFAKRIPASERQKILDVIQIVQDEAKSGRSSNNTSGMIINSSDDNSILKIFEYSLIASSLSKRQFLELMQKGQGHDFVGQRKRQNQFRRGHIVWSIFAMAQIYFFATQNEEDRPLILAPLDIYVLLRLYSLLQDE